ncbi:hypothetical protein ACUODJ_23965, partial [Escherichia sp. HC-CC]
ARTNGLCRSAAWRNRTEFYKLLSRHELDANDFKE